MALLWCDGFEGYGDTDNTAPSPTGVIADKYIESGTEVQLRIQSDGYVDWGLQLTPAVTVYDSLLTTPDLTANNTVIAGVAFYIVTQNEFNDPLLWPLLNFRNNSGDTCARIIAAQGASLYVMDAGDNYIGSCRNKLDLNEYHFIEMKVLSHETNGTIEVRINGCPVFNATSVNTANSGSTITRVSIGANINGNHPNGNSRIDNFYVCDGSGNTNNNFLGDVTVKTLWPDGDDTTEFATTGNGSLGTHYEQVYYPERTETTNYVEDSTTSNQDIFTMDALSEDTTIYGVVVWGATQYDTSNTSHQLLVSSNGTVENSATIVNTTSAAYNPFVVEDDPDTGNSWNQATINAMLCGIEVV